MTTVLVPRPPVGCTEQPPMIGGEVVRWSYTFSNGASLTIALRESDDGRSMQCWTGPGTVWPSTSRLLEPSEVSVLFQTASLWLTGWSPQEPTDQLGLFDEEVAHDG